MMQELAGRGVLGDVQQVTGQPASEEQLLRAHSKRLVQQVRTASMWGQSLDADTYTTTESYDLARIAAGCCCQGVDMILSGAASNGMALVRPPGHHAERDRVGGFCLFNNVAIAARQAQVVHGVQKVAIVDFDVHHGNGTQDIFYEDENVLFVSLHLYHPFFYPGTGSLREMGRGAGEGATVNVPFPPGTGDRGYRQAFEQIVLPKLRQFRPGLVLVSAGFDAHWLDPLASAGLSLTGYAEMVRMLVESAGELAEGRIFFVLEGGYRLEVLRNGILNTLYALLGRDQIVDPFGANRSEEADVTNVLRDLKALHLLNYP
jgi:acetoin utilization deacetylase AcuC-like enzyme